MPFNSSLRRVSSSASSTGSSIGRRKTRRIVRQIIIGCGIALVSLYALTAFGLEVATRDLFIAFAIGITLIIVGFRLDLSRRVPRLR